MPNEVLPRYAKGERLRHGDWNRLAQTVEGHDRLVTGGGLLARKTGTALELYDPRMRPIDARITGNTNNAYSWEQVQQFEGGVYATPAGARTGTATLGPAYARSGSTSVPTGTYVVLWPQFGGLFYLFDAPTAAGSLTVKTVVSQAQTTSISGVTAIETSWRDGLVLGWEITAVQPNGVGGSISTVPGHTFVNGETVQILTANGGSIGTGTLSGINGEQVTITPSPLNQQGFGVGYRINKTSGTAYIAGRDAETNVPGIVSTARQGFGGAKHFATSATVGNVGPQSNLLINPDFNSSEPFFSVTSDVRNFFGQFLYKAHTIVAFSGFVGIGFEDQSRASLLPLTDFPGPFGFDQANLLVSGGVMVRYTSDGNFSGMVPGAIYVGGTDGMMRIYKGVGPSFLLNTGSASFNLATGSNGLVSCVNGLVTFIEGPGLESATIPPGSSINVFKGMITGFTPP